MNIWDDEWGEQDEDWSGGGGKRKRLVDERPAGSVRPSTSSTAGTS